VVRFHRLEGDKVFLEGTFLEKIIVTWAVPFSNDCTVMGGGRVGMGRSGTPAPSIQSEKKDK
jgi:hypothetical protein